MFFWRERLQKRHCDVNDSPINSRPPILQRFVLWFMCILVCSKRFLLEFELKFVTHRQKETNSFPLATFWEPHHTRHPSSPTGGTLFSKSLDFNLPTTKSSTTSKGNIFNSSITIISFLIQKRFIEVFENGTLQEDFPPIGTLAFCRIECFGIRSQSATIVEHMRCLHEGSSLHVCRCRICIGDRNRSEVYWKHQVSGAEWIKRFHMKGEIRFCSMDLFCQSLTFF